MNNVVFSTRNIDDFIADVANEVISRLADTQKPKPKQTEPDPLKDFISRQEAKKALGIKSDATLWRHENAGRINRYTIGGKVYYKRSELVGYLTKK